MTNKTGILQRVVLLCAAATLSAAQSNPSKPNPITGSERFKWTVNSTVGLPSVAAGVYSAGLGTLANEPVEYGPHWEGFGKRFGMRLTGVAVSNTMEASLGAAWGEDPRYPRAADQPFKQRVGHVIKMTFMSPHRSGRTIPAYARFAAIGGSNYLSNTWRADSEATSGDAAIRIGWGFLGRMTSNAFLEFWPDVKKRIFKP